MAKVVTIKTFDIDGTTVNATGDPANFESWTDGDSAVRVTGLLNTLGASSEFQEYWKVSCDLEKFTNGETVGIDDPDQPGSYPFTSGATDVWGGDSTKFSITCSDAPVPDPSPASSSSGLSDEEVAGVIIGSIAAAILLYVLYIKYFTSN